MILNRPQFIVRILYKLFYDLEKRNSLCSSAIIPKRYFGKYRFTAICEYRTTVDNKKLYRFGIIKE